MIDSFTGQYHFLSNFAECQIPWEGLTYQSVEAAYQASKTLDHRIRREFTQLGPTSAKHLGQRIKLRPHWEEEKVLIMYQLLKIKFAPGTKFAEKLLATRKEVLIEGNWWGDKYWGTVGNKGKNMLGKLLMRVRRQLRLHKIQKGKKGKKGKRS